jgi:murein L,D-transpeptidase YafK
MSRSRFVLLIVMMAAAGIAIFCFARKRQRSPPQTEGERRVNDARRASEETIRARFHAVALPYPPRELFVRAFKHEAQLELWAREDAAAPFKLVHTWPIVASSGGAGPKRREGDRQVPEGFYVIDRFNPESLFHLSLGINYPNASDRLRSDPTRPGGDIFIHGRDRTIGCIPLGDPAIEELFLAALDTHRRGQSEISVHIFPGRMKSPEWEAVAANSPALATFWDELRAGYVYFERTHRLPSITVDDSGAYTISANQLP